MLNGSQFNCALADAGISFFTGVPCSLLGDAMQDIVQNPHYIGATSEGEALAVAAGAWLTGKQSAVFLQNSGLGNLVNPLTSLNAPFGIPALLVIGWRGTPGIKDEPQHELMGSITLQLLDLMNVPYHVLSGDLTEAKGIIQQAIAQMQQTRRPVALLVRAGTFNTVENLSLTKPAPRKIQNNFQQKQLHSALPTRFEILQRFTESTPSNTAVIATTGKCGRELYTIKDQAQHLYMVGAMGSASAVGLGIALNQNKNVAVLDGDGAALMRLGTFALIGREAPKNFIHILLDNAAHDSTGGQATGSEHINFCVIAAACGYKTAKSTDGCNAFSEALSTAYASNGPHFIHVPILAGSQQSLARPDIAPYDVSTRFAAFLKSTC